MLKFTTFTRQAPWHEDTEQQIGLEVVHSSGRVSTAPKVPQRYHGCGGLTVGTPWTLSKGQAVMYDPPIGNPPLNHSLMEVSKR